MTPNDKPGAYESLLRDDIDPSRVRENWLGVVERRARRKQLRAITRSLAVLLLCASAGTFAWLRSRDPAPIALANGAPVVLAAMDAPSGERIVTFDDASSITLGAGSRVAPRVNEHGTFALELERGVARFEVTPGGDRRWSVRAEDVLVEVVGTGFSVERRDGGFVRVAVWHGRVRVVAPSRFHGERFLGAGEELTLPGADSRSSEDAHADAGASPVAGHAAPSAAVPHTTSSAEAPRPRAPAAVRSEDRPRVLPAPVLPLAFDAAETMALADAARRAGRIDEAAALYERVAEEPSSGARAGLAALIRARLELHSRGRADDALVWTDRARALGLSGALEESWLVLRVDSMARAGMHERARREAQRYVERFPEGPLAGAMRERASSPASP